MDTRSQEMFLLPLPSAQFDCFLFVSFVDLEGGGVANCNISLMLKLSLHSME